MAKELTDYKPVYLIYGEQELLVEQALMQLKSKVGEIADLDFNMETFDGESADADEIVSACNTFPFASDRRLVIVRNVDKMLKNGLDALVDYAGDPSPTTILALMARKVAKNTRLYKAVDKIGGLIEREAPKAAEFPRRVQDMFANSGKRISLEAAELLVAAVGKDLRHLSVEIEKVVAFVGDRTEVGLDDIERVASTTAKASVWELGPALANRDCAGTLKLLNRLLGDGESVYGLHAVALRQVRELLTARALIDRGAGSTTEIARALGRPDWQVKNLPRQARAFTPRQLVDALRAAAVGEAEMKTSRDPRLVFERWIVKVCG